MFKTFSELKEYCKISQVKMIDFKIIDLNGRWRHLTIPVERLSEKIFVEGIGFDGSNYGYAPTEKSDMVFIPDLKTAFLDPFCSIPTMSMIGDIYIIDAPHRRFPQDPRKIAEKCEQYLVKLGFADEIRVSPEFEFYVFDNISYQIAPNKIGFEIDAEQAEWNTCRKENNLGYKVPLKEGYHADLPYDANYNLRSQMCELLEERGVKVKYHHHEVGGPGQQEIEVESGGLKEMSDKTMLIKYIVKNAARQAGKTATFMPKPIFNEAGSGMHLHMHLFKEGKPVFYDEKGYSGLSETALYFIGGILKHARALSAFVNPSTNSYKRLVPGYEAPINFCFATANRSSVIRIPDYAKSAKDKRFEYRAGDGTANPYFAFTAIIMAGIDGVKNRIDPIKQGFGPYDVNLYNLSDKDKKKIKTLPRSLDQALDALEKDWEFLTADDVFPKELIDAWISQKRKEAKKINLTPNAMEFNLYYDL
ncbi:MAG: type I glutamate--ammonia ligase [Bacillota bacterium]|jgi:glutamine synthetase|nr:type I glutamate--ammonia ligase [Bacillota bacterium]HHU43960.1 type I glutamate--ammonia ligase [Clostridiales bacterium]